MCRLMLGSRKAILALHEELLGDRLGLFALTKALEDQCGGHGNGVALWKTSPYSFRLEKGEKFSTRDATKRLLDEDYDWAIFHTRIASAGKVSSDNCHPFVSDDGNIILAMNGTESFGKSLGLLLGNKTDTEAYLHIISKLGLQPDEFLFSVASSAVWVGANKGVPFVVKNSGDLVRWGDELFVSSLPKGMGDPVGYPAFRWVNGKILNGGKTNATPKRNAIQPVASHAEGSVLGADKRGGADNHVSGNPGVLGGGNAVCAGVNGGTK